MGTNWLVNLAKVGEVLPLEMSMAFVVFLCWPGLKLLRPRNQMDVDMDMNMPMGDVDIGIDFDLGGTDLDGQIAANAFNNATPYKVSN